MEFLKQLNEAEWSKKLKYEPLAFEDMGTRVNEHIRVNDDVKLSIQASYAHYCIPRKTLPNDEYECMEMAIINGGGEFSNISDVTDNKELIDEFEEFSDGTVYGYVPVEMIEKLYQELKKD